MSNANRFLNLDPSTPPDVAQALRYSINALEDHNQAFTALKAQLNVMPTTSSVQSLIAASKTSAATGDLNMAGFKIVNLGNPQNPQDAVNKAYVDAKTGVIIGTHATRLTTKPNLGGFFFENDRTSLYLGSPASGTCDTAGTAVTWDTGTKFDSSWTNASIIINGVSTIVTIVGGPTSITVADNLGVQAAAAFQVPVGIWQWCAGLYSDVFANRPADLAACDTGFMFEATDQQDVTWRWESISGTLGFKYEYGENTRTQSQIAALAALLGTNDAGYLLRVTDYKHTLVWGGAAFDFVEGDGSGQVAIGKPDGTAPNGGLWAACDGTNATILKGDGTTAVVITQNLTGNVFIKGAASTAGQRAADSPTWQAGAKTDDESAHTHQVTIANNAGTVLSGPNDVAAAQTVTSGVGTAHHHTLSNANAVINPPSEANQGLPLSIQVVFWIRR